MKSYICHGCGKDSRYDQGSTVITHMESPQNPYLDVNRMIFVQVGQTYQTNKVGDLVPMDFLSLLPGESVYVTLLN